MKNLLLSFLILSIAHQNFGQALESLSFDQNGSVKGELGILDMNLNSITLSGNSGFSATGALYDATQTEELMSIWFSISANKDVIVNLGTPQGSNMASHLDPITNYKIIVPQGTVIDFNNVNNSWPATDLVLDYTTGIDNVAPTISFAAVNSTFDDVQNEWEVTRDFKGPYLLIADEAVTIEAGATITFTNQEDNSIQYTIPLNSDNVTIQTPQNVTLPTTVIGITLDEVLYAAGSSLYEVELSPGALTDGRNVQAPAVFNVLQFRNVPENPSIFGNAVDQRENLPPYRIIGTFETGSGGIAEDDLEWRLLDNSSYPDNQFFYVSGSSLATNISFDWESKDRYNLGIRVGLPGGPTKDFEATIFVTNSLTETMVVNALTPISSAVAPAAGNPIRREFSIEFNSEAVAGSGSFRLYRQADNSLVETLTVGTSSNIIFDGNLVKLFPNIALNASTGYYWEIDNGAVQNWPGFNTNTDWRFVTGAGPVTAAGPYRINLSNTSVEENQFAGAFIGTLNTDNFTAGRTHTYVFAETGTTTNGSFSLVQAPFSGPWSLSATSALDFEGQKEYILEITSNDGTRSFTQGFTISVTNTVSEPPTDITFNPNILVEDKPIGELAGTLSATDPEGQPVTFTLPGTTFDNGLFNVVNGNEVVTTQVLSTSTQQDYEIYVRVADADGYFFYETFSISLMPDFSGGGSVTQTTQTINFPTIPEQSESDTYTLNASSSIGLEIGYSIVDGPAYIQQGNQLKFTNAGTVTVAADQPGNFVFSAAAQVTRTFDVTDNVPPQITNTSPSDGGSFFSLSGGLSIAFDEDISEGTGNINLHDAQGTVLETIPTGTSDSRIQILSFRANIDFSTAIQEATVYQVSMDAGAFTDLAGNPGPGIALGALSFTSTERPNISSLSPANGASDVNTSTTLTVDFDVDVNTFDPAALELRRYDNDALVESFDLTGLGDGFGQFVNGTISLSPSAALPESVQLYIIANPVGAIVSDNTGEVFLGLDDKDDWTFTTAAGDTSPPKIVSFSPADDATNVPVDASFVATFDEPIAFFPGENQAVGLYKDGFSQFFIPEGDARLSISGNVLTINFTDDLLPNTNYSIWVRNLSDLNENYINTFNNSTTWNFKTRAAVPVNESPTAIALSAGSIDENNAVGDVIGAFSTKDSDFGDTHTYTLVAGTGDTDNASFIIDGENLKAAEVFDFETKSSYNIRVQTDDGSDIFQEQITIFINSETETDTDGPQLVSLSPADGATNVPVNVNFKATFDEPIAFFPGVNQAVGLYKDGVLQFFIPEGDSRLTLSSNLLTINFTDDLLPNTNYSIWILDVSDVNENYNSTFNSTTTWNFKTRAVVPINEAPTAISLDQSSIDENNAVGDVIGAFSTEDTDFGATHTYELVAGSGDTDNDSFTITDGKLEAGVVFDFETKVSYSVRVQTDDSNGGTFEEEFTITINDVAESSNSAPTAISLNSDAIAENNAAGDVIGTLSTTDPDAGDTHTYSLIAGTGGTDNTSFTISGSELQAAEVFDFETKNSYSIRVETNDGNGGTFESAFTISITDVEEKQEQTITIEPIEAVFATAADFEVTATTSSSLELSYAVLSGPATIAGSTISLTGETGTVEIEVSQAGNENFLAATATTSFTVLADPCADFAATAAVLQNVSCNAGANGSFSVNPTAGTGPFTYIMGETSQEIGTFENLSAGTYEVSITDANGCSATASVEITAPEAITATAETTDSNSIFGNGSISLTVSGGTGVYSYEWSNGATSAALSDLGTGEYTVSITDEAGCSLTESYTIGGVTSNTEVFEMRMYPNPVLNQLQIRHAEGVEQISLLDATGKIIQQEQAMDSQTTVDMKSLPAGLYFIRLDDGRMNRIIKQ